MTVSFGLIGLLAGVIVVISYTLVRLAREAVAMHEALARIGSATYELTTMAEARIHDLQDSLRAAGIPLSGEHVGEHMRRMRMTPEESMAEFDAVVARFEELRRGEDV